MIYFVRSVSFKKPVIGSFWLAVEKFQPKRKQLFKLTHWTKRITPSQRAIKTVPKNYVGSCVHFCFDLWFWKDVSSSEKITLQCQEIMAKYSTLFILSCLIEYLNKNYPKVVVTNLWSCQLIRLNDSHLEMHALTEARWLTQFRRSRESGKQLSLPPPKKSPEGISISC